MSKQVSLEELDEARSEGRLVVDVRDPQEYSAGHIPGAQLMPLDGLAGRVAELPKDQPVYVVCQKGGTLIGKSVEQGAKAQRELVRIGIDRPVAQATATVEQLSGGRPLASFHTSTFAELVDASGREPVHVLEVHRDGEWNGGHITGAQHIALHELLGRIDEVPDLPVWVHCASGVRASIAASILEVAGRQVTVIVDDFAAALSCGVGVTAPHQGGDDRG